MTSRPGLYIMVFIAMLSSCSIEDKIDRLHNTNCGSMVNAR